MKSRISTKLVCLGLAGVMAAGSLFAVPRTVEPSASISQTEDWNFRAEASKLLQEIQSTAALLNREAAILHSFTRGGISRESHASQVSLVKDHINAIGQRLDRLQAIRHVAATWQRQAIDSIVPARRQRRRSYRSGDPTSERAWPTLVGPGLRRSSGCDFGAIRFREGIRRSAPKNRRHAGKARSTARPSEHPWFVKTKRQPEAGRTPAGRGKPSPSKTKGRQRCLKALMN